METSLVGGLKKLKARRAAAKLRKRVRPMGQRLPRQQVSRTARPSAVADVVAVPAAPAVAVPYIVAHRRSEKFPTIKVSDDGSYIRLSTNVDGSCDMRAVCGAHTLGQGQLECNLSRTCRVGRGGNLGRPLGLLCWFLERGRDPEIRDKAQQKQKKNVSRVFGCLLFLRRLATSAWCATRPRRSGRLPERSSSTSFALTRALMLSRCHRPVGRLLALAAFGCKLTPKVILQMPMSSQTLPEAFFCCIPPTFSLLSCSWRV